MPQSENTSAPLADRLIWALHGVRRGDNQQVSALARALGGKVEDIYLEYSTARMLPNLLVGESLLTVKDRARAALRPPWPDVVIAAGRRAVGPARWIKRQSGGRAKLVQLGRPRAPLRLFDLVITTPQYGLPTAENMLFLPLPLQPPLADATGVSPVPFAESSDLPRPWTGVLIGGSTWPFMLDARTVSALAADLNRWVGRFGGSALITTSPRSDPGAAKSLEDELKIPFFLHRWVRGADNPYEAILRAADRIIVTGDSVSMLADAYHSGKPTAVWRTPQRSDPLSRICRALGGQADRDTAMGALLRFAAVKGLFTPPRHVERLMKSMTESGRAQWFDAARQIETTSARVEDADMQSAINRVRALFG